MTDPGAQNPANLFDLTGRVALVTGAAQGFGRAFSHYLAHAGADVAVVDINADGAEATAAEVRALGRQAIGMRIDVRDAASVQSAVDRTVAELGRLSILVNNAGINTGNDTRTEDLDPDIWTLVIETNLTGYFRFCQAAWGPMQRGGGGKIINVASAAAARVPRLPGRHTTAYTVSKAAVVSLTRCLGLEWAQDGICVNSISPTYSNTGLIKRDPAILRTMLDSSPFGRLGEPSDLNGILLYLASAASDFTTGQDFLVDGGYAI
jgi:NAD(P)-dependent dehydrogenase (short-subunit alcohol dehydrogenase family)